MRIQIIKLCFNDDDPLVYVDKAGTEDAAESQFLLQEHLSDGDIGTIEFMESTHD